jgi:hypothetical protein
MRRVIALAVVVVALPWVGCGGSSSQSSGPVADTTSDKTVPAGTSCGQPTDVPGEIVIDQPMACSDATRIATAYFASGKAPGSWHTGSSKGWECGGNVPGKRPVIAQCDSYSTAASAQTQLSQLFEVRPTG